MPVLDDLKKLSPQESRFLTLLLDHSDDVVTDELESVLQEIFNGAHMVFYDNGALYQIIKHTFPHLNRRFSSHVSSQSQYSFWGDSLHECLFSTRELTADEKKDHPGVTLLTWVQLENSPMDTLWDLSQHAMDYLVYRLTGKNVGPMGLSSYTEKHPRVLRNVGFFASVDGKSDCALDSRDFVREKMRV